MIKSIFKRILIIFTLLPSFLFAQGITDHLNNDVYSVVNGKSTFSLGNNTIGITLAFFSDSIWYKYKGEAEPHVTDASAIVVNVNGSNFPAQLNNFFTPSNQPTITINFGYAYNTVTNFNNWDDLKDFKTDFFGDGGHAPFLGAKEYDLYFGIFVAKSFINYWDTVNKKLTDQSLGNYDQNSFNNFDKFFNVGAKLDYNLYYTKWLAVAFTTTLQNGITASLASFQSSPTKMINTENNIYETGPSAGKLGNNINLRPWDLRFSIGTPIFIRSVFGKTAQEITKNDNGRNSSNKHDFRKTLHNIWGSLFLIPFYAPDGWSNTHWTNEVGVTMNVLQQPYGGLNSKIVPSGGFGIDWQTSAPTKNGWSGPQFYITGKINIGSSPNSGAIKGSSEAKSSALDKYTATEE